MASFLQKQWQQSANISGKQHQHSSIDLFNQSQVNINDNIVCLVTATMVTNCGTYLSLSNTCNPQEFLR